MKKPNLDRNILKNYRPVSNLPFISKILEKVVLAQLQKHLTDNGLLEICQSAYRQHHSTETALLAVTDDLLTSMDNRLVSVAAFLDQSAAFDTLDHHILLQRLSSTFGISSLALQWIESYLSSRTQAVTVNGIMSHSVPLLFGVPQGSVLGPLLFTLYTQPLSQIIQDNHFLYHKYADDTELQKASPPSDFTSIRDDTANCIADVKQWMNDNKLKLNEDKTELLAVADRFRLNQVDKSHIQIGSSVVPFQPSAKYLGVHLDETLSMDVHISAVCRLCNFHLRKISSIRQFLSVESVSQLVSSMILSRLDYCNSTLSGLPSVSLNRLQKVQNHAARLILRKRKTDHVSPLLKELHWLPVEARIKYKMCVLAFKHFQGTLPPYLSNKLQSYTPSRTLRSSAEKLLKVPKYNLKTSGLRTFHVQATLCWNSLPSGLRDSPSLPTFQKKLKTHLFSSHFC